MGSASSGWFGAGSSPTVNTNCNVTLSRSGTTVTCNWSVEMQIGSGSHLDAGSLVVHCQYDVNDYSETIKPHNEYWGGGKYASVSGSYSFYDAATTTRTLNIRFYSESDTFGSSGIFNINVPCSIEGYNPSAYFTTQPRLDAKQVNTATIYYKPDRTLHACEWRLYSGSSWSSWYGMGAGNSQWVSGSWSQGGQFKVISLSPNTPYKVQVRIQATSGGPWTNSNELSFTTYQIGQVSAAPNFNHGSSGSYTITNPASASLSLAFKIGSTTIKSVTPSTGNNTISFNDTELDNMYKLYGNGNTLTATYLLTTTQNNTSYTHSRTCTITLTGNQKTARENISGSWKRGKYSIKVNNNWKSAVIWIKQSGSWKRGI